MAIRKNTKKAAKTTRTSAKAKLTEYKLLALQFINSLRYPGTQNIFTIKGYEKVNGVTKPNHASIPELLAIVGTATKLGKKVQISVNGYIDGAELSFDFVDAPPAIPSELQ